MKKTVRVVVFCLLLLPLTTQQTVLALQIKILGPTEGTLAPDTEYGFGLWIQDPGGWLDLFDPYLALSVTGGIVKSYSAGTFDGIGFSEPDQYTWHASVLLRRTALIGHAKIRTDSVGNLKLTLTGGVRGTLIPEVAENNYTIAPITGEPWEAFSDLAKSRARTNEQFASLYTALCDVEDPPITGDMLFVGIPETQKNALRGIELVGNILAGIFEPSSAIANILLQLTGEWTALPTFLGVIDLWTENLEVRGLRYHNYFERIGVGEPPLGPVGYEPKGSLNDLHGSQMGEATAWQGHQAKVVLDYLADQEDYIKVAVRVARTCLGNARERINDEQGVGFFSGLIAHLEAEKSVIEKLREIAGALIGAEILDDSSVAPQAAEYGDTITVHYRIKSWFQNDQKAWLGATIRRHDDHGDWASDPNNDIPITLLPPDPGSNYRIVSESRPFTIPKDEEQEEELDYGSYDVEFGIHSGSVVHEGKTLHKIWKSIILTLEDDDTEGPVGSEEWPNGISRSYGGAMFSIKLADPSGIYEVDSPVFYGKWDNSTVDESNYDMKEVGTPVGDGEYCAIVTLPQEKVGSILYWRCHAYDNDSDREGDRTSSWSPSSGAYTVSVVQETVATPTFSPDGGTHTGPVDVTISCSTPGAVIHYTTNGTEPTESDAVVASGDAATVDHSLTLQAKGWKSGWTPSDVKSADYTITGTVATPTFSPDGGTHTGPVDITISCSTLGAVIHYTTDGTEPTESGPVVASGDAVTVDHSLTLQAKAWKPDWNASAVKSADYVVTGRISLISPNGGETWYVGETHDIRWTATGIGGNVEVRYSTDSGATYPYDVNTVPAGEGSHPWMVPGVNSTHCRVRIQQEGGGVSDESDSDFTIRTERIIYVDTDASGANDGSSWDNAYNYLQDALGTASSLKKAVEIRVAQGIYRPDRGTGITPGDRGATFRLIENVTIKGGYAGVGEPDPDARDINAHETILSGDLSGNDADVNDACDLLTEPTRSDNSHTVLVGTSIDETAVLDGFTISGGSGGQSGKGGGMWNSDNSGPTLTNSTFTANSASEAGGGMYSMHSSPTLANCTFSGNSAGVYGGGMQIYYGGALLTNCAFSANSAGGGDLPPYIGVGGGMAIDHGSPLLTNCVFSGNSTEPCGIGGGIQVFGGSPLLTNCIFSGNSAGEGMGGGGMCTIDGDPMLANCTFSGNSADPYGGGIFIESGSPLLTNCIFSGNSAGEGIGGGMCTIDGDPMLANCTFSGNSASLYGGGIFIESGSPLLVNCIVWGDTPLEIVDIAPTGTEIVNYSNVQGGWPGLGNINVDPCFADPGYWDTNDTSEDLSDDFWVDGDYHLKSRGWRWHQGMKLWTWDIVTSKCIDAGNPGSPLGDEPLTISVDPGNLWGQNLRTNMGAYGGTAHASIPPYDWAIRCDLTNDGVVEHRDLLYWTRSWLGNASHLSGDVNRNGFVDTTDFALFAEDWLAKTSWFAP